MNPRALRRYSRHLLIPEVGLAGQERLTASRVLVVGAGGLGSPALQYLAAAGVGRIGIVDDDVVDETNLQRQTIFATADVGRNKAAVAAERLRALNPLVAVDAIADALRRAQRARSRAVVRRGARLHRSLRRRGTRSTTRAFSKSDPTSTGRSFASTGRSASSARAARAIAACIPNRRRWRAAPTCAEGGVLGVLAGIVGSWQASEALKVLLRHRRAARRAAVARRQRWAARVREVRFERDPQCALCGERPAISSVEVRADEDAICAAGDRRRSKPSELDDALREGVLLDVREPHEAVLGSIDGALCIPASQLEARLSSSTRPRDTSSRAASERSRCGRCSACATRDSPGCSHLRGGLLAYAARHEEFEFF